MTKWVIAVDPSGNFGTKEGYGTTGFAVFNTQTHGLETFVVRAKRFATKYAYFEAVTNVLSKYPHHALVMENFRLYPLQAKFLSGQVMGTPELIGSLTMVHVRQEGLGKLWRQNPVVKNRWPDVTLWRRLPAFAHYTKVGRNPHERDALRHLCHLLFVVAKDRFYGIIETKEPK